MYEIIQFFLKKPKKTQKNPKKPKKPKKTQKTQKNPKKPAGLGFFKKTRVFSHPGSWGHIFHVKKMC